MKYRAKITAIQTWVSENFVNYRSRILSDGNDVYIEVGREYTAELLEQLNKVKIEERRLQFKIIAYCDDRLV